MRSCGRWLTMLHMLDERTLLPLCAVKLSARARHHFGRSEARCSVMTQAGDPTTSRYDHTRTLIVPIEIGAERILEALVAACEAPGEDDGVIRCFVQPVVGDDVVRHSWEFKYIYLGDVSLIAHFKVMILISPNKNWLVLLVAKMNMPENDLNEDCYEAYADCVRTKVSRDSARVRC